MTEINHFVHSLGIVQFSSDTTLDHLDLKTDQNLRYKVRPICFSSVQLYNQLYDLPKIKLVFKSPRRQCPQSERAERLKDTEMGNGDNATLLLV